MKIKYSKKRLRTNLILGCAWTILSIAKLFFNEELKWSDYALFVLGLLYFGLYFYEINYQYITRRTIEYYTCRVIENPSL